MFHAYIERTLFLYRRPPASVQEIL